MAKTTIEGKKLKGLTSRPKDHGLHGIKLVVPKCQVPIVVHGRTEWTSGPCTSLPTRKRDWYKTCPHGPEFVLEEQEDGTKTKTPIPEELRPYYETKIYIQKTPILDENGNIKEWEETTKYDAILRIEERADDIRIRSGRAVRITLAQGAKWPAEFGIAPFCELHGCFSQDLTKFRNGLYCSDLHAAFVYARQTGVMLPLGGFDGSWPQATSSMKRREVLTELKAQVVA